MTGTITKEDLTRYLEIGHQLSDLESAGKLDEANKLRASLSEAELFWVNMITRRLAVDGLFWRQVL